MCLTKYKGSREGSFNCIAEAQPHRQVIYRNHASVNMYYSTFYGIWHALAITEHEVHVGSTEGVGAEPVNIVGRGR
jgi:hypothetical protein